MNENNTQRIDGSTQFVVLTDKFIISPLSADTDIYIDGFSKTQMEEDPVSKRSKKFGTTAANDYTTCGRCIVGSVFHLNTTETFYVKWS